MLRDFLLGVRMLRKQPGFAVIAIVTLALGIGATAAVFSLIQGVLLTPPPYRQPDRMVLIPAVRTDGQTNGGPRGWPSVQWMDWQQKARSFEAIAGYGWSFNFLVSADGSESLEGMWVTRDYFRVTGLQPVLGRTFTEADGMPSALPVVILGYDVWQRKFNGDRNIVGKTIRISRQKPPTVIGVMGPGVRFLPSPTASQEPNYNVNAVVDFWMPAVPNPKNQKQPSWDVVGRLKSGVGLRQAEAELALLTDQEGRDERDFAGIAPRVQSLTDEMNRDGRRILIPLLGAAALVLLIACGNVAALLLVRGLQRQQEYAVRSALGVGRIALFRQVSMEGFTLALLGGVCGVALAFGVVKIFKVIGGHAIPRLDSVTTGWPVLVCGLGSAILAAGLAALIPALRASRMDPIEVLKSAGPKSTAGRGERRLLRGVTMVQMSLTLALLVGAGLLIRTMINLAKVPSGYHTEHILTMSVTAVQGDMPAYHHRALERVSALPGVQGAAFAWGVPLTGNSWPGVIDIEGQPAAVKESDKISLPVRSVTEDYFNLLGLAIADGRAFRSTDTGTAPKVGIVNQAFADRYLAKGNPIGKKVRIWGGPPTEIVGLVVNGRTGDLTQAATPEIYVPFWQQGAFSKSLIVRTAADAQSVIAAVQRELRAVDPTVAVENVKTLDQIRDDSLASRIFAMQLLVGFSIVGSVLTLVGIYGVLSLSVASRRREIAIRAAVGAANQDIRNLIFAEAMRITAGGVVSGLAVAVVFSRLLKSFLFEVEVNDPLTLIGVAGLFSVVALLACWVPARRAVKVDPLEALRYE